MQIALKKNVTALWKKILKTNFTDLEELADFLNLSPKKRQFLTQRKDFPLNLPRRLAAKIQKNSLTDPIFQQFVPLDREHDIAKGFVKSPVCDENFQKTPKLLQKYNSRVLFITTSACAMNCRFCFRQNYPYETSSNKRFENELGVIKEDPSIIEVILSGGDPLSLSDDKLQYLIHRLEEIPHVKLLRFHTRFPIGIPERICSSFLSMLEKTSLQVVFVTHINHPKEIDEDVCNALKSVQKLGVTMLNHSVLLKGVNDDFDTLYELCKKLIVTGVTPYYLNQLDPVSGAAHFDVEVKEGIKLVKKLREELPGYAVPTYIQEIPNEKSKTPLHTI
ncbi:EF-P beta-lysylation protein EpmB [Candidatus Aerophobetes bacterium]|uniref:L-lysine 2,3-aminomutase n=1 Tax=Aerophobetes bacterium TaxID=2030807 RepID=A0A2A4YFN3_UNCAE|nr:MAG: EF-P beta-lysylation protein EpmB [Candidatus Aerophobetes bacterium]